MRINADSFVSVGICILGLVGVGYAIGVHSKMKVMCGYQHRQPGQQHRD